MLLIRKYNNFLIIIIIIRDIFQYNISSYEICINDACIHISNHIFRQITVRTWYRWHL